MKKIIESIIFIICFIGFPILASAIVNILSEIITMEMIMTVVYIALGFSVVYILKN